MPKVNTFNYDTIASWNGSQDLFVVEQPDGTKVATPLMVKQFIEAGDFEATGEIKDGHGNILNDLAGQVSDIGDDLATIHPSERVVSTPVLEMHGADDKPIRIYETADVDYKAICIYDKNNVERYALRFLDGHLTLVSKDANGTVIVSEDIINEIDAIKNRNNYSPNLMKNRGDVGGDLNNVKVNGLYTFRTSDTNTPTSWGTLMVINVTPDNLGIAWIFQVAFGTDGHIYHRRSINGAAFNALSTIV